MNRQFTEEFELMAGYTFAKTIDDASSDIEQPHNPYDLARGEGGHLLAISASVL